MATYWDRRARQIALQDERIAKQGIVLANRVILEAQVQVSKDIDRLYETWGKKTGLDASELKQIVTAGERADFIVQVQKTLGKLGIDFNKTYSDRYLQRLTRLRAIQQQLYWSVMDTTQGQTAILNNTFDRIIENGYAKTMSGLDSSFQTISAETIDKIKRTNWSGVRFSERIWENTDEFAQKVIARVAGAVTSGTSLSRVQREIRQDTGVAKWKVERLVVTEANYFQNQAVQQAYVDSDIERYEYVAVLDGRTSHICRDMDGQIFDTADLTVGENFPPLHPYCRSYTKPVVE